MSDTRVITDKVRIAFPNLITPREGLNGGLPKYSAVLLLPKDTDLKPYQSAIAAAIKAKWGSYEVRDGKTYVQSRGREVELRLPIRPAAERAERYEGFDAEGWFINASANSQIRGREVRVAVINTDHVPITNDDDVYAGCWCRFNLNAYAYDNKTVGVNFGIQAVMKVQDDERFGGVDHTAAFGEAPAATTQHGFGSSDEALPF